MRTPLWVHIVGAALGGAAFVTVLLVPGLWSFVALVLLIAFNRLTRQLRPETPRGPIPRAYIVLVVVLLALVFGGLLLGWYSVDRLGLSWVAWVVGVVVFAVGIAGGVLEDRIRSRVSIRPRAAYSTDAND